MIVFRLLSAVGRRDLFKSHFSGKCRFKGRLFDLVWKGLGRTSDSDV